MPELSGMEEALQQTVHVAPGRNALRASLLWL